MTVLEVTEIQRHNSFHCTIFLARYTFHSVVHQRAILRIVGFQGSLSLEHQAGFAHLCRQESPVLGALVYDWGAGLECVRVRQVTRLRNKIQRHTHMGEEAGRGGWPGR